MKFTRFSRQPLSSSESIKTLCNGVNLGETVELDAIIPDPYSACFH